MENEKIEILGAWKKGDLFLSWKFQQPIGKGAYNKGKLDSQRPMHDDLRLAFAALEIHMPIILKELDYAVVPDINAGITGTELPEDARKLVELFSCTGIEVEVLNKKIVAASLIGTKALDYGPLTIQTPFIIYEGAYPLAMELQIMVDRLISEVEQYIDGKQAPVLVEPDMFADSKVIVASGDPLDTPKRTVKGGRGRKKKDKGEAGTPPEEGQQGTQEQGTEDGQEPLSSFYDPAGVAEREAAYNGQHTE